MLRRLRAFAARAPRVIISLVIVAFALPALAGPLAYCLAGDEGSRVVAAASHCESTADATATTKLATTKLATTKPAATEHLPAIDESVNASSDSAAGEPVVQRQRAGSILDAQSRRCYRRPLRSSADLGRSHR